VSGVARAQAFVEMRDGVRLNTLAFLPAEEGPWPVILARTPYGITRPPVGCQTRHAVLDRGDKAGPMTATRCRFGAVGLVFPRRL